MTRARAQTDPQIIACHAPSGGGWWKASAVSWLGLLLSIGTMLFSAGSLGERVSEHEKKLGVVQAEIVKLSDQRADIIARLSSIDTKLGFIIEGRKKRTD